MTLTNPVSAVQGADQMLCHALAGISLQKGGPRGRWGADGKLTPGAVGPGFLMRTWSRYRWRLSDDPTWGSPRSSIACSLVGATVLGAPGTGNILSQFIWLTHTRFVFALVFLWLFFVSCALLGLLKRRSWICTFLLNADLEVRASRKRRIQSTTRQLLATEQD